MTTKKTLKFGISFATLFGIGFFVVIIFGISDRDCGFNWGEFGYECTQKTEEDIMVETAMAYMVSSTGLISGIMLIISYVVKVIRGEEILLTEKVKQRTIKKVSWIILASLLALLSFVIIFLVITLPVFLIP